MNYVEIPIVSFKKYIVNIRIKLTYSVEQSIENDDLYKPLNFCLKVIKIIKKLNQRSEDVLNDIYEILRKYYLHVKDFINGNTFVNQQNIIELRKAASRAYLYLKSCYLNAYKKGIAMSDTPDEYNDDIKFRLHIDKYANCPYTEEYIMYSIILHEDNIFFFRLKDSIFKFFYFYKTIDNEWYWSPPRKTDKDDIWMKCPKFTVEEGHWKGMSIPRFVEEFVVWLDLLKPDLPYLERVSDNLIN